MGKFLSRKILLGVLIGRVFFSKDLCRRFLPLSPADQLDVPKLQRIGAAFGIRPDKADRLEELVTDSRLSETNACLFGVKWMRLINNPRNVACVEPHAGRPSPFLSLADLRE